MQVSAIARARATDLAARRVLPRVRTGASFHTVTDDPARAALLDLSVEAGPTTTLVLTGDLDPATAPKLGAAVAAATADASVQRVVLDLGGVNFLDSSGLRVFVTAREALADRGGDLVLRNASDNIRRLLDITGLGEVIDIE